MSEEIEKKDFVLPKKADSEWEITRYFVYETGINSDLIEQLIKNGDLYQDTKGNAIFVHRDKSGNIIGGEGIKTDGSGQMGIVKGTGASAFEVKVGTNRYKRIDKDVTPQKVIVFENAVDMLSYMQLHPNDKHVMYTSMAGRKMDIPMNYVADGMHVELQMNDDKPGRRFHSAFKLKQNSFDSKAANHGLMKYAPPDLKHSQNMEIKMNKINEFVYADIDSGRKFIFPSEKDRQYFESELKLTADKEIEVLKEDEFSHRLPEDWKVKSWRECLAKKKKLEEGSPKKKVEAWKFEEQAHEIRERWEASIKKGLQEKINKLCGGEPPKGKDDGVTKQTTGLGNSVNNEPKQNETKSKKQNLGRNEKF